jgi:endonuclease/exonuclease/phosphatase family metal-dependent hydrolase
MRLATYNIEWFDNLFANHGQVLADDSWLPKRQGTRAQQVQAVATVLRALDADAVMIIEAPNTSRKRDTVKALEGFAARFDLRTRRAVMGFANDTQQEIALLYDDSQLSARHDPQASPEAPAFDQSLLIDLDVDATHDEVRFSKPPLELAVQTRSGKALRLIGAHLKSKAPHGARNRDEVMRISIANRRKQLAQAIWLHRRARGHLQASESLMIMGDLNDGPGLDEFEHLFGRSSVEIILGEGPEALYDRNAALALGHRLAAQPNTARFYISSEEHYLQALLDYIMVSKDLRALSPRWRIWHPFDDPGCWRTPALRDALLMASDHFPVTIDLEI